MLEYIIMGGVSIFALWWLTSTEPQPVNGIYRQRGKYYYFKAVVFRLVLRLRELRRANSQTTGEVAGYGVKSKASTTDMEQVQPLPDPNLQPMAVDAVYFSASNSEGYYLVTATARRQHNKIQQLTYLMIPEVGLFELPAHPETLVDVDESMAYAASGLSIKLEQVMKTWRIRFDGELRHTETKKLHRVTFDLTWTAKGPYFDFDTDMNTSVTVDSIAREPWSRDFFNRLKLLHQTHYEQFGITSGKVAIEGYGDYQLELVGVRDHSYGNIRTWKDLHRYGIQYFHLEDGSCVAVGVICIPKILSRLVMGYIITADGQLHSVSSTTFELYEWGEDGRPPKWLHFQFIAGGKTYRLRCEEICSPMFYMRDQGEPGAFLFERLCKFTVNGVKGTGISEWCYADIPRHQRGVHEDT